MGQTTNKIPTVGKLTTLIPATDEGRDLMRWWTQKKQQLRRENKTANEFLLQLLLTAMKSKG